MLRSFSEFKFYQSFRIPVEEADQVRFLVEIDNEKGKTEYIDDAKLVDVSLQGIGFTTTHRLSVGQDLSFSLHFKKQHVDLSGQIVRAFTSGIQEESLLYGVEFEETDLDDVKRFLEQYILSFSPERLRDSLLQMALVDRYASASEGLEMFSLMISLFKDMTNFAEKSEFVGNMLEEVVRIVNAQRATILLVNPETNELEAHSCVGIDKKLLKFDYRKGIAGSVFTSGVSINLDVIHDNIRFSPEFDEILGIKTKSVICNPITNREDKVIGVVEIVNKRNEDRFTVDDEKIMKMVSLVFSSVFHNYNPISSESAIRKFSTPSDRQHVIIGKSKHIANLRNAIVKLKDIDSTIYIHGESGTGKSLLARILHFEGKRGLKKFEEINCGGQSEDALELELFGNDKTMGKIESADGGTLLIKAIHVMPFKLQKKLMEVMISGRIPNWDKNGETNRVLDTRLIVSSNKNLEKMVVDGRFNRNFFEFIAKTFVTVPPLRKREDDIKDLINYFLKIECKGQGFLLKTLAPSVIKTLLEYEGTGNIRELRTCIG
ncbi:MAG: sigma 54-interacting transcriptional regulator, partial [Oligoflexia bacterium]|nr:sigma 54-interacting transcriptional regulator [Oligoflexia bacterium]